MNEWRWLLWILGPVLILFGSFTLARWTGGDQGPAPNEVLGAASTSKRPLVILTSGDLAAECRLVGQQWGRQLGPTCEVECRPPFVMAGDVSKRQLNDWYVDFVLPTTHAMAGQYVGTLPNQPVSILLFADATSYNHYIDRLFGEQNISVYGYYKPGRRTLVVNTETGGGTLVHELTHAMLAFDFPEVSDWFNEGLASLHEQCRFRREPPRIEGLDNWRGELLIKLHTGGRLRSLEQLFQDDHFRGSRQAANYAHARYFCLFMQDQGVLPGFYRQYRDNHQHDSRGQRAVQTVFGVDRLSDVDRLFRQWLTDRVSREPAVDSAR